MEDEIVEEKEIKIFKKIVEWCFCIFLAIIIALARRYYIFTSTVVKQSSMYPTLNENQRIALSRINRITKAEYKQGDIVTFEEPSEIKGNLVEGFSFTNEPVQFAHTAPNTKEKPKVENQKSKNNNTDILDMRKLSIVNGLTPPIDGEKLEYKRCYMLRFSTLKKLEQIKAMHPDIIYISSIVDMAINHYFHCLFDNE